MITSIFEEHTDQKTVKDNHNLNYGLFYFLYTLTYAVCIIISCEHLLHIIMILMCMFESGRVR